MTEKKYFYPHEKDKIKIQFLDKTFRRLPNASYELTATEIHEAIKQYEENKAKS